MVDVRTETNHNSQPVNPRTAIREARQRRLRLVSAGKNDTVKVYAANEMMRAVLRHPAQGTRFRQQLDQPVEWPNDSFTKRRIADGSVRTDGPGSAEEVEVDETLNPRQQSAARKAQAQPTQQKSESESETELKSRSAPQSDSGPQPQPQPAD